MKRLITCAVSAVLFLILPLQARAAEYLIPVGQVVGLQLRSGSVTVAAYDDVLGSHARSAGIKIGDEIIRIGQQTVACAEDVRTALEGCGEQVQLTVRRDSGEKELILHPQQTEEGPRLGIYLRQGISGIGTVTFYDPETGLFGTLGHGVCDAKGKLLEMQEGSAYEAAVASVRKGRSGDPGQLKGSAGAELGKLLRNTPQGVFGRTSYLWPGEALPTADYGSIQTGSAVIRSTIGAGGPKDYSVEILKIYPEDRADGRNFLIRVTDPSLLETTGGIVQGMSGSPIIQDGKLVGAVTHVLVNDPARGYGIFIENMLDAAE
ncbi:MAG: SpoIVB peptidase [Oscillospiraceae bacterium]|nr:SpoIVB peptidase [Oscillospiraceae bacterium]